MSQIDTETKYAVLGHDPAGLTCHWSASCQVIKKKQPEVWPSGMLPFVFFLVLHNLLGEMSKYVPHFEVDNFGMILIF
ncbi:hypothetical protein Nepgr_029260 [Nepenthes gracilis]|uniref:Uncharacterized protein n=1 Tax=Nepenthes gracilis TaxID=150966 RepID=A0AAD3Y2U9_NEPGR|nr:hypothetical protein Nepgr_029260 [Nepenthes gracilis]